MKRLLFLAAVMLLTSCADDECVDRFDCRFLSSGEKQYTCIDGVCSPLIELPPGLSGLLDTSDGGAP